jgi:NADPH-dependent curcumin reductase CurA
VINESWIVAKASHGIFDPSCLTWQQTPIPSVPPGRVLVRTVLLSVDPTTRNWLKLDPRLQFIPFGVGDPVIGVGVGVITASRAPGFEPGMMVTGCWGWQRHSLADPAYLEVLEPDPRIPMQARLSVFSHVGRAAIMGLVAVANAQPGETVLVSGAAGATGSLAAAIAKSMGCRTVGVAGGPAKCRWLRDELQLDAVIDYRAGSLVEAVAGTCPDGVHVYFDNVGGELLDAVLLNMAIGCRIVVCGMISQYDLQDASQAHGVRNLPMMIFRRARMEGFVVPQFQPRYAEFDAIVRRLYFAGKLPDRAHVIEGLEKAPEAVRLLFDGSNDGKLMVRVSAS